MNFPKTPVVIEKVTFYQYKDAYLYLSSFVEDDVPVLFIGNDEKEEIYAICNINTLFKLHEFEFAIKNYSENEGMLEWLISNNFMEMPHSFYKTGFVTIPLCYATPYLIDKITEICL